MVEKENDMAMILNSKFVIEHVGKEGDVSISHVNGIKMRMPLYQAYDLKDLLDRFLTIPDRKAPEPERVGGKFNSAHA
jgi:hypothetical protein